MNQDIARVIISEETLLHRVQEMGHEIAHAYADNPDGMTIVAVLSGAIIFLADLIRFLPMKLRVDLVTVSSYPGKTTRSVGPKLTNYSAVNVRDRDVLIVDDILDTGSTLSLVQAELTRSGPRSLRTAVLLRKPGKAPSGIEANFVGFDIEDEFVVGYGLDYDGMYRNLPYVGLLRSHLYE